MTFTPTPLSITEPVTKFGGQPVWLAEPEWAISRETSEQMQFICQIALESEIFGDIQGRMAYIFMTNGEDYVDGTWEPDGGENAVVIQPNGNNPPSQPLTTGPALYAMEEKEGEDLLQEVLVEFAVELTLDLDPDLAMADDDGLTFEETKIGGTPIFLQGEEYPGDDKDKWRLLLQLDSASVPFYVNFGDVGVGYAFISRDGRTGKFLWQCV